MLIRVLPEEPFSSVGTSAHDFHPLNLLNSRNAEKRNSVQPLTKRTLRRIIIEDMPPLTAPDKPLGPISWRLLLLVACVLVFAFALHAKVAVYHQSATPQTSTSAKLWIDGEKTGGQPLSPSLNLVWFATFVVLVFSTRTETRIGVVNCAPAGLRGRQLFLRRFLRPPPVC